MGAAILRLACHRRPRRIPSPTQTQLDFDGTYQPPLGAFGAVVDSLALHRFAEASVTGFVREVAGFLRNEISRRHAEADPTAHAVHPSP